MHKTVSLTQLLLYHDTLPLLNPNLECFYGLSRNYLGFLSETAD